ncbi:MAG: amidohydrolase [bacterium]|nr:amidohydrolase [bacterium]
MLNLTISCIQAELAWEDREANIGAFNSRIDLIKSNKLNKPDLIILPEMFTTGFSMEAEKLAERMDGPTAAWLREKSQETGAHIMGSCIIEEQGSYYNRLLWAEPDGALHSYNKKHLFGYAGEDAVYSPGTKNITVEVKGWKIRPFICYDLRFPLWTRNFEKEYDIAIFIANWPQSRSLHWKTLLRARAIENQSYVIGVNRVGTDGKGISYSGDTSIISHTGEILYEKAHEEAIETKELSYSSLAKYRESFPAWKDADTDLAGSFIDNS